MHINGEKVKTFQKRGKMKKKFRTWWEHYFQFLCEGPLY